MSKREQEFAHTAGLLHDIGKFALSDRVMERGGELAGPRLARRSAAIRTSAPSCCATSASTARWRRSCAPTTSASTAAGTRAA